ncbi:hypothetical protein [Bowmanella yangjiangensis]|uniref:Uncharacterized protein n=1 Tax=Bowmanella yangjiangensis TaxID=2811230 RepID=A0ABS3CQG4_9ALTE|nr:hypothetical protein [Bowmanella yangjiangensis]MBN7819328.1 hypothetical protein [Bowmanella yangjiangensis]
MKRTQYYDPLYGKVELPTIFSDLIKQPVILRLQSIGLMNFRSLSKLSLTSITRLEHSIGTAILVDIMSKNEPRVRLKYNEYICSAIYHDISCASFGHAVEWAIARYKDFDHVEIADWIIPGNSSINVNKPVRSGISPVGFLTKNLESSYKIDPKIVKSIIDGEESCVINSETMDLDNIDNVSRMALYIGLDFDKNLPISLATNLRLSEDAKYFKIDKTNLYLVENWMDVRAKVYHDFIYSSDYISYEYMIFELVGKLYKSGGELALRQLTNLTDNELLKFSLELEESRDVSTKLMNYDLPDCISIISTKNFDSIFLRENEAELHELITFIVNELSLLKLEVNEKDIGIHITTDNRKTSRRVIIMCDNELIELGDDVRKVLFGIIIKNKNLLKLSEKITNILHKKIEEVFGNSKIEKKFIANENLSLFDE